MSQEKNLLHLCENCLQGLHAVMDTAKPQSANPLLNQKLFLLETALSEFQKKHIDFEQICDRLSDALYITDKDGTATYANVAYQNLRHLITSSLEEKSYLEINNPQLGSDTYTAQVLAQVLQSGKPAQIQISLSKANQTAYISASPIFDELGVLQYAAAQGCLLPAAQTASSLQNTGVTASISHEKASTDQTGQAPYTPYLERSDYSLKKSVENFEREILLDTIAQYGSKRKAAAALKMDHSTLIKKCQRYGI
ncbi:PAS domain-containing protein [Aminipila butyrica]|uniref:PAS domain-containing protein n=1 Tax=Aminipila butyrica TaxID=433296 RepID=A0A858BY61_9FIRM|nr:PAS domain-containing protein [Aminipila butyrica]QIB70392.1 PAS domain-containing protein [Aminipila butyrica]